MTGEKPAPTIHLWLPVLVWIGAILAVSSIPGPTLEKVGFSIQDKLAHTLEYGILGIVAYRQRRFSAPRGFASLLLGAWLLGGSVGAVDELHQLLIPGRTPDPADWLADAGGMLAGCLLGALYYRLRGSFLSDGARGVAAKCSKDPETRTHGVGAKEDA